MPILHSILHHLLHTHRSYQSYTILSHQSYIWNLHGLSHTHQSRYWKCESSKRVVWFRCGTFVRIQTWGYPVLFGGVGYFVCQRVEKSNQQHKSDVQLPLKYEKKWYLTLWDRSKHFQSDKKFFETCFLFTSFQRFSSLLLFTSEKSSKTQATAKRNSLAVLSARGNKPHGLHQPLDSALWIANLKKIEKEERALWVSISFFFQSTGVAGCKCRLFSLIRDARFHDFSKPHSLLFIAMSA